MNIRSWMALALACALVACGGGGGGGNGGEAAGATPGPQLTALSVGPTRAYTGAHPGTLSLSGTALVAGLAANGVRISLVNAAGVAVAQSVGAFAGGPTLGAVGFSTSIDTSALPAGTYRIEVQVTSSTGGLSNALTQAFQLIAYPWRAVGTMPHTVSEFAIAAVGTKAYVLAGLSTVNGVGTATADVQVYDTVSGQWSSGAQAPHARAGATAAAVGTDIYLMGGYDAASPAGVATVDVLDTQTGTWRSGPATPTARFYSCSAAIGSSIYLAAGAQSLTDSLRIAVLERLDTTTGTWVQLAPAGYPAVHPGCAVLGGSLYVNGGDSSVAGFSELVASQWYDPALNLWSTTNFFSFNRSRHGSVAVDGRVVLIGGRSDAGGIEAPTAVTEVYDPTTNKWSFGAPMPAAAGDVGAVVIGGLVHVFTPTSSYTYDAHSDLP